MYLKTLKELLGEKRNHYLFPCIRDLVVNGLMPDRFSDEDHIPTRQDVTQHIAAWFRHIGLLQDECRQWMVDYCPGVLSAISSSSNSQIRHSTKSNIKYIYRSDVPLDCGCKDNRFRASCERSCPAYDEMALRAEEREAGRSKQVYEATIEPKGIDREIPLPKPLLKDAYKDQFDKAIALARDHLSKGVHKKEIVHLLNESGFKTRTGRRWSYSILAHELKKLK